MPGGRAGDRAQRLVCPRCARLADPGARMCKACLASLEGARAATEAEVAARETQERSASAFGRRRRLAVTVGLLALFVVFGGWALFIRGGDPSPIPAASGTRTAATGATWGITGGDLAGTGRTSAAPRLEAAEAWRWSDGVRVAVPAVADGERIYLGLTDGRLVALDAATGEVAWDRRVPGVLEAPPTVAGDRLYAGLRSGDLVALEAATGAIAWSVDARQSVGVAAPVVDGTVYTAANGHLTLFDADTGAAIWDRGMSESLTILRPVIEGDHMVLAAFERVLIFDRTTGRQTSWHALAGSERPARSLTLLDGTVVLVTSRQVTAIDVEMRRPWYDRVRGAWRLAHVMGIAPEPTWRPDLWTVPAPREVLGAVADNGQVIVAGGSELVAYDLATGEPRWRQPLEAATSPPVLASSGVLLAEGGSLTVRDPATGEVLERREIDLEAQQAVVTDHGTYLVGTNGEVLALR